MTQIKRTVNAGTLTAIGQQHTQPFHICELALPTSGTQYLSEGPQVTFNSGGGNHNYLEGRILVSQLNWTGGSGQNCVLEVLDNTSHDGASWFLNNKMENGSVIIWIVYRNSDGSFNTPVKYAVGSCDSSELLASELRITVITNNATRKFTPSNYIGTAGFEHIPQDRAVVIWNNTNYELQRAYE